MSDESPFGDFTSDQTEQQSFDEDQPIALPPPTEEDMQQHQMIQDDDELEVDDEDKQQSPLDDDFGLSSQPAPASTEDNDFETSDPFATVDGASSSNAGAFDSFSGQEIEVKEEEAAALKAWEKERATVLRDRASKAAADKEALLKNAREEVSKFYSERDATVAKNQKTNRADEKNYRADMKSTFESGAKWEKVNKLVSTQPKANEKPGTSRVDRMRKLLIQLKTEKPKQ